MLAITSSRLLPPWRSSSEQRWLPCPWPIKKLVQLLQSVRWHHSVLLNWLTIRIFVPEGHRSRERADRGRVRRPGATGARGVPPSRLRHHSRSGLGGASGCRKGRRGVALERVGDEGDLLVLHRRGDADHLRGAVRVP